MQAKGHFLVTRRMWHLVKAAEGRVGPCCGRRLQRELSFLRWDGAQGPGGSQGLQDFTHTKLKLPLAPFSFSSFSESFSCSFTATTSCKLEATGGFLNTFPQKPKASSWDSLYPTLIPHFHPPHCSLSPSPVP